MSETPPVVRDRPKVVFEPGGYARFAGTPVPPAQRVRTLVGVFARDQWRSVKSKLFGALFVLPALVMAVVVVVRAKLDISGIAVPHADQAKWIMQLLHYLGNINAGFLLLGVATQVAPLIARDGHQGALLLYFSRPVLRSHYLLARVGAAWLSGLVLLAGPALLLILIMLSQYGLQPGGCPFEGALGALWWMALVVGQVATSAAVALVTAVAGLAAGVVVRNPSSAPLAFGGTILASIAGSWVLQAAWGKETAARAVDLHRGLLSLWDLLAFPLDPDHPPATAAVTAGGGILLWITVGAGAWWLLQRYLHNPPLGKGRA